MEFANATRLAAGFAMAIDPDGRERLVVVAKGTFALRDGVEPLRLLGDQPPLIDADTFTGEPGFSAPLQEMDFAPSKPACDVLLVGDAVAPYGEELTRMRVGLRVGTMVKVAEVVGDRVWDAGLGRMRASSPRPFERMPVGFDRAFGGTVEVDADGRLDSHRINPVGRGWHPKAGSKHVEGRPLPNVERVDSPVASPDSGSEPVAFGPLGRGWSTRACHAGTYDQRWLDETFPFLPTDFDLRYHLAAPEDQRLQLGAEALDVVLSGFFAEGSLRCRLPDLRVPIAVHRQRGRAAVLDAVLDTIAFDTVAGSVAMTWRASLPLAKNMRELAFLRVGSHGPAWWQRRSTTDFPIPIVSAPVAHAGRESP